MRSGRRRKKKCCFDPTCDKSGWSGFCQQCGYDCKNCDIAIEVLKRKT